MILTKEMKNDFRFMSLYSYTKRYKKMPFDERIFWNNKIMFATNGNVFLWTETTEENPEEFSVWEVQGKNFVDLKGKDKEELKNLKLEYKVFNRYNNFGSEFEFNWDKSIPLPVKLCSKKQERTNDKCFFDFAHNDFIVKFSKDKDDEVIATYGDFLTCLDPVNIEGFSFSFWKIFELMKKTKDVVKVTLNFAKQDTFNACKMVSGKWNIIAIPDNC